MLRIATNTMGINTHRSLKVVGTAAEKASERLSSGLKINRAADDAAGLAISEKIRNQINGLNRAQRNVEDGISLVQTADAGMNEISEMLTRQRELTVQAMNDTNAPADRQKIQSEIDQLSSEITSLAERTEFNTIPLLTGGAKIQTFYITLPKNHSFSTPKGEIVLNAGDNVTVTIQDLTVPGGQNTTDSTFMRLDSKDGPVASGKYVNYLYPQSISGTDFCDEWIYNGASYSVAYTGYNSIHGTGGDGSATISGAKPYSNGDTETYWHVTVYNADSGDPSQPAETSYRITVAHDGQGPIYIKSGANEDQGMYVSTYDCRAASLGVDPLLIDPLAEAELSLAKIDGAIDAITSFRSTAGAEQNRLEHTSKSLGVSSENLESAKSRISDTDMAKEMMEYTKGNILQQAGISMLAQANQSPQRVLELIR